jgi:predicted metal-dependent hydrolase
MADGRAAFNRGDFFLAHELWEEVWRSCVGPDRSWLQALIQIAAGLHHLSEGRPVPAQGLLARALEKLGDAPARLDGIDFASARREADRLLAELRRGDAADPRSLVLVDG